MKRVVLRQATLGERTFAFMIDLIIITLAVVLLDLLAIVFKFNQMFLIVKAFLTLGIVVGGILLKDIIGRRSLGKRLFGLEVRYIEDPDVIPTLKSLIVRNISLFLSQFEFFMAMFSPSTLRYGDVWSKTIVVKMGAREDGMSPFNCYYVDNYQEIRRNEKKARKSAVITFVMTVVIPIAIFIGAGFGIKYTESYKYATSYIESDHMVMDYLGTIEGYGAFTPWQYSVISNRTTMKYDITVDGSRRDCIVYITLMKGPEGHWQVVSYTPVEKH